MGYSTPSLAHLHQYLVAAHLQSGLTNPLRNVPLPVHSSPLYKTQTSDNPADGDDRKRKRSDSGIEDRCDAKVSRYDTAKLSHVSTDSSEFIDSFIFFKFFFIYLFFFLVINH